MFKGLLCGIGGGLVGACVWATLAHFMGGNADFSAWIVGVCVGVGVAFGAQPKLNFLTGTLAATLAAGSVIVASFAAAEFATGQKVETARINTETMSTASAIEALGEDIQAEWDLEEARAKLHAPAGTEPAPIARDRSVHEEAKYRWASMGVTNRQLYRAALAERRSQEAGQIDLPLEFHGYFSRMTTLQIVWFSLAIVSAFRIGAVPGRRLDELEKEVADAAARNNPILRGSPSASAFNAPGGGARAPGVGPSTAPSPMVAPSARGKAA